VLYGGKTRHIVISELGVWAIFAVADLSCYREQRRNAGVEFVQSLTTDSMGSGIKAMDGTHDASRLADESSAVLFDMQIIPPATESSTHHFGKGV
jgi:hypothetical protein